MTTSNSVADKFECPNGFSKEHIVSQLYFEDLGDNSELWLIRMPCDIEPSAIENVRMTLDGTSSIVDLDDGANKQYECFSENCEMSNLCLVLPCKESGELRGSTKTFKGSVFVTERTRCLPEPVVKVESVEENRFAMECSIEPSKKHKEKKHKKSKGTVT